MKKPLAFILALALLLALAACGKADEPVSITSPQTEFITTDIPPTTLFIWVEEWEKPIIGESGSRRVGVKYKEVDLTKHWCGYIWNEVGIEIEPRGDLSQILGHRIETRDEAARIANEILVIEQGAGLFTPYVLSHVERDLDKNIWIFIRVGLLPPTEKPVGEAPDRVYFHTGIE